MRPNIVNLRRRPGCHGVLRLLAVFAWVAICGGARHPSSHRSRAHRLATEYREGVKSGTTLHPPLNACNATEGGHQPPPDTCIRLGPTSADQREWHFSFIGVEGSPYEGGIYHGRFLIPNDYPAAAPRVQMLTKSGRFVTNRDICLSVTSMHQEAWLPVWTMSKLVTALRTHMLTEAREVGGVTSTFEHRALLARASREYRCSCGACHGRMARLGSDGRVDGLLTVARATAAGGDPRGGGNKIGRGSGSGGAEKGRGGRAGRSPVVERRGGAGAGATERGRPRPSALILLISLLVVWLIPSVVDFLLAR
mmetsp:Transcript_25037/g.67558  ORF Transcript_25037/g.67558 Transcript_25037/m.67558 type:complete len:309 (-) Transcript_25037:434-1360(-)